jgi:hypothetical protein
MAMASPAAAGDDGGVRRGRRERLLSEGFDSPRPAEVFSRTTLPVLRPTTPGQLLESEGTVSHPVGARR